MKTGDSQRPAAKRDQIWQRANAEQARRAMAQQWSDSPLEEAIAAAKRLRASKTFQARLEAFWVLVLVLERHAEHGGLAKAEIARVQRLAAELLAEHGIKPRRSRLRFMPAALHDAMAAVAARDGDFFAAAWRDELANHARRHDDVNVDAIHRGLLSDDPAALIEQLMEAELALGNEDNPQWLRLARARLLRLTGATQQAQKTLASMRMDSDALRATVLWERASLQATQLSSAEPLMRCLRIDRAMQTVRRCVDLWLWAHAERSKQRMNHQPRISTLRRRRLALDSGVSTLTLQCARTLERCRNGGVPLARRLAALGEAVENANAIAEMDHRLLFWAAATRWLVRVRRRSMAVLAATLYHDACLRLSEGANDDVFGVLSDVTLPSKGSLVPPPFSAPAPAPRSTLARQTELARMLASLGSHQLRQLMSRLVRRGAHTRSVSQHAAELGDIAAHFMGHMKGPLMKLGQMLSFYGFDLPVELTHALSELQADAEPMAFETARRVVEEDLSRPLEHCYHSFEPRPIGVGSIGQVHRARLCADGREVAVKVQFPDIQRAVTNDLRSLRVMAPLLRYVLSDWDISGLLTELGARIVEECDYRREAKAQQWFRQQLTDHETLVVPEIIESLCSKRVLTSSYFSGQSYELFCAQGSEEQRARAAAAIFEYVIVTMVQLRHFNTDIHPGNFLFNGHSVAVIDFGSTRRWSSQHADGWERILRAVLDDDQAAFSQAMLDLGMVAHEDFDWRWAFDLVSSSALSIITTDRPEKLTLEQVRRELLMFLQDHPDMTKVVMPPRWLYGFRAYWGFFAILAGLDVALPYRQQLERLLER